MPFHHTRCQSRHFKFFKLCKMSPAPQTRNPHARSGVGQPSVLVIILLSLSILGYPINCRMSNVFQPCYQSHDLPPFFFLLVSGCLRSSFRWLACDVFARICVIVIFIEIQHHEGRLLCFRRKHWLSILVNSFCLGPKYCTEDFRICTRSRAVVILLVDGVVKFVEDTGKLF